MAENLILTNGYKKEEKVYSRMQDGEKISLSLNLIVNKEDSINVNIANSIKKNLSAIGIEINVEKLSIDNITDRLNNNDYDLVIANVYLNESPDISFIKNNLYISETVQECFDLVESSSVEELPASIYKLQLELSNNVSIIGIYSDVSYVLYSKEIIGIEDVSFLNIFSKLLS